MMNLTPSEDFVWTWTLTGVIVTYGFPLAGTDAQGSWISSVGPSFTGVDEAGAWIDDLSDSNRVDVDMIGPWVTDQEG